MKHNKLGLLALGSVALLAACSTGGGNNSSSSATGSSAAGTSTASGDKFSIVMVTDTGGVDDASFNQGAWEAMQAWGKENGKEKGREGYDYIHSKTEADFITNYNTALAAEYDLIFGIGYKLADTVSEVAEQNPDKHFVIVDSVVDKPNVASLTFADHESAFLAGVAAAKTSKTNHIGFIGGVESEVITRFESGFIAGAKSVNKDIKVDVQYVGDFSNAANAGTIATSFYSSGADVIYPAAGGAAKGVFTTAINLVKSSEDQPVWVIGVDIDQAAEGQYTAADGSSKTVTLASTLKGVGTAVKEFANETMKDGFKGGRVLSYSLKDGGVDLSKGELTTEVAAEVASFKEKIVSGDVKVPQTKAELEEFLKTLN